MAIRQIREEGDPLLRKKSREVEKVDEKILELLDDMYETLKSTPDGVGLAAPQVGILKRIVTIDLQEEGVKKPYFLINPEIIECSKEKVIGEEGCLSVPDQRYNVERYAKIKVKFLDKEGKENIIDADGLFAICLQHEIDHLDDKLYIDYLSKLKQNVIFDRVKKILKNRL